MSNTHWEFYIKDIEMVLMFLKKKLFRSSPTLWLQQMEVELMNDLQVQARPAQAQAQATPVK